MTLIATDVKRISEVIAHEYEPTLGYCRKAVSISVPSGMKKGAVIVSSGALVTVATTANAKYVVIDDKIETYAATPGTYTVLVLERGPAILKQAGLQYGADVDTAPEIAAVNAVLATLGIIVEASI